MHTQVYIFLLTLLYVTLEATSLRRKLYDPKTVEKKDEIFEYLDDIDYSGAPVVCGEHKCFFRSKTVPSMGYLLPTNNNAQLYSFDFFKRQHTYAKCLEKNYNVFYSVAYPILTDLSQDRINTIFQNNEEYNMKGGKYVEGPIVLLPVRYDPNSIILKTCDHNSNHFQEVKEHMKKYLPINADYRKTFIDSLYHIKNAIREKVCLFVDFEVIINPYGQVSFFDLDRCDGTRSCTGPDRFFAFKEESVRKNAEQKFFGERERCISMFDELMLAANSIEENNMQG